MSQPKASALGDKKTPPATTTYRRVRPPSHYSFEIQSLSEFLDSKVEKYETGRFTAGGYQWRLILYPNGDKQRNVEGFISLYITLDLDSEETKAVLSSDGQIIVDTKLFVYDWIFKNYRVIQGMEVSISKNKPEWGFEKLLTLQEFEEEHNGYVDKDRCIFGAEVVVMPVSPQRETLSMIRNPDPGTFTWKIVDFGKVSETDILTETFPVGDRKWKLRLYPNGDREEARGWLSLFLHLADPESLPPKRKVYAKYKLRVLDQSQNNHFERVSRHWFDASSSTEASSSPEASSSARGWGRPKFLQLEDLHDESKGFLMNDTLMVEVEVVVVSVVERSPDIN